MAGSFTPIYRNLNNSDTEVNTNYSVGTDTFPTIDALGWSKDGYQFKEYNLSRDGTGTSYQPGENILTSQNIYVIWEEISNTIRYIVEASELTSIADAIREKTGESGSLIYPSGFVSAIEEISGSSTIHLTIDNNTGFITTGYYTGESGVSQMNFEVDMETYQVNAEIDPVINSMLVLDLIMDIDFSDTHLIRIDHVSEGGNRYVDIYQVI